jgi:hypothetical protein
MCIGMFLLFCTGNVLLAFVGMIYFWLWFGIMVGSICRDKWKEREYD